MQQFGKAMRPPFADWVISLQYILERWFSPVATCTLYNVYLAVDFEIFGQCKMATQLNALKL